MGFEDDLSLRSEIDNLCAQYAHLIDDDWLEELPGLFTRDGIYRVQTRENHDLKLPLSLIYCNGADMLADRITALRTANIYEPHVYCHMLSALRILGGEGAGWRVRSNFVVVRTMAEGSQSLFASGRYFDRIVRVEGALKFQERIAIVDSRQIDTLLVIPL